MKLFLLLCQKLKWEKISICKCKIILTFDMDFFLPAMFTSHPLSKERDKHCQRVSKLQIVYHMKRQKNSNFQIDISYRFDFCHIRRNRFCSHYKGPKLTVYQMLCGSQFEIVQTKWRNKKNDIRGLDFLCPLDFRFFFVSFTRFQIIMCEPQRIRPQFLDWLYINRLCIKSLYLSYSGQNLWAMRYLTPTMSYYALSTALSLNTFAAIMFDYKNS